jgi:hypothetical protein
LQHTIFFELAVSRKREGRGTPAREHKCAKYYTDIQLRFVITTTPDSLTALFLFIYLLTLQPIIGIYTFIIHSRALNQSVIVERVTCRSNILRYWTGTYWTVANCGFFHGFSTLFRCFVNFKHTTNDMAE